MKRIKTYLSARISEDAHAWNDKVCDLISDKFEVFKPHEHNPYNQDHRDLEKSVYQMDLDAMIESEIGLLLTPYGRDCSWEIGWYSRSDKPVVMYVEQDTSWRRDWMIKGGIDQVFVVEDEMYELLKSDRIVADKITKINSREELTEAISVFFEEYKLKQEDEVFVK